MNYHNKDSGGQFFLNHLFSFLISYKKDFSEPIKFKQFTNLVFLRVFPIHFFIIFGGFLLMISFLLLGIINFIFDTSIIQEKPE